MAVLPALPRRDTGFHPVADRSNAHSPSTAAIAGCITLVLIFFLLFQLGSRYNPYFIAHRPVPVPVPHSSSSFVGLTPEAVNSIPIFRYSTSSPHNGSPFQASSDGTIPTTVESHSCSICTEDFNEGIKLRSLPCGHVFHPMCIDPWLLKRSVTCPLWCVHLDHCRSTTALTHSICPPPHSRLNVASSLLPHNPQAPSRPRRTLSAGGRWIVCRRGPRVKFAYSFSLAYGLTHIIEYPRIACLNERAKRPATGSRDSGGDTAPPLTPRAIAVHPRGPRSPRLGGRRYKGSSTQRMMGKGGGGTAMERGNAWRSLSKMGCGQDWKGAEYKSGAWRSCYQKLET